jgi:beta-lactamase regulating signal transducer with metallopeptidase domain
MNRVSSSAGIVPARLAATPAALTRLPAVRDVASYLPILVWAWSSGVLGLSIRSLGGWAVAVRFARRYTRPAEEYWEAKFRVLAKRLAIARPVRLVISGVAQVPAVVGSLRPVVLFPASLLTGLSPEQIESLLAHELAHVRRHDYLVNLLQTAAETLLFYHPAVWWISRNIRCERENCCDDLAVEACGSSVTYARALTQLEVMRSTPRLAMAADGGSLLSRVERILQRKDGASMTRSGWAAALGLGSAVLVAFLAADGLAQSPKPSPFSHASPRPRVVLAQQSAPAPRPDVLAQAQPTPAKPGVKQDSGSWLDQIEAEGYRNLNVDQLIGMKVQGIDGEYIRQLRTGGYNLNADQLVAFRVQGITGDYVNELEQAGFRNLDPDEIIGFKVQGVTGQYVRDVRVLGYPTITADQLMAFRVQGITRDYIEEMNQAGFQNLSADMLIGLKVQGITGREVRELKALGFEDLTPDTAVGLKVQGVTPEFIMLARKRFPNATLDQILQLKIFGILKI